MPRSPREWSPRAKRELTKAIESLDSDEMLDVYEFAGTLHATDSPSGSDISNIFRVYLGGSEEVREGVDAAFRWWTGYNFDSVIAQFMFGKDWEDVVELWRSGRKTKGDRP